MQAYLSVAPYVAGFPEYFEPLARHLLLVKLRHWEKALRELAAQALAGAPSSQGQGRAPWEKEFVMRASGMESKWPISLAVGEPA
jgi:hypothetical protein